MTEVWFGSCQFKYLSESQCLTLQSSDLDGIVQEHHFYLSEAFLVHIGGHFWRFVTGVGQNSHARFLFEDMGEQAHRRVRALQALGVPVLSKEEGKLNLERHNLPVKRLVIAAA